MKRLTSYWVAPFQFSDETIAALRKLLRTHTDPFLRAIAEELTHYAEGARAEVPRQTVRKWRTAIDRIGINASAMANTIRSLDAECGRWLDTGLVLESGRIDTRDALLRALDHCAGACARVVKWPEINPKGGAPADFDRRRLACACAAAYQAATGNTPKTSPNGTFAKVLLVVMRAARAVPQRQKSVSKEFLTDVLAKKSER